MALHSLKLYQGFGAITRSPHPSPRNKTQMQLATAQSSTPGCRSSSRVRQCCRCRDRAPFSCRATPALPQQMHHSRSCSRIPAPHATLLPALHPVGHPGQVANWLQMGWVYITKHGQQHESSNKRGKIESAARPEPPLSNGPARSFRGTRRDVWVGKENKTFWEASERP